MQELSLMELYNKLADQQAIYGEKIDRLYDMFSGTLKFPDGVTNSNDAPGLWPDTGVNVYAILSEYNLAEAFCTVGVLLNIGSGRYKYQLMLVQEDELRPEKNGKLYYRYCKKSGSDWSAWKRSVQLYELTGSEDAEGNPIIDEYGKQITDTEDLQPEKNKHNGQVIISAEESDQTRKLKKPVKIELTDLVSGFVEFDGSEDVQIAVESDKVIPINVRLKAQMYDYDAYRLLCTLPESSVTRYDYVTVTGHIGGWSAEDGKAYVIFTASNRGTPFMNGLVLGTINNADIVVYQTENKRLNIYLLCKKDCLVEDIRLSVVGSEQAYIDNQILPLEYNSREIWRLSTDATIVNNKTINAKYATPFTDLSNTAEKVSVLQGSGNLLASDIGDSQRIKADSKTHVSNGVVTAEEFVGKLTGVAEDASKAATIKINEKDIRRGKACLLGSHDGYHTPVCDTEVYLMSNSENSINPYSGDIITDMRHWLRAQNFDSTCIHVANIDAGIARAKQWHADAAKIDKLHINHSLSVGNKPIIMDNVIMQSIMHEETQTLSISNNLLAPTYQSVEQGYAIGLPCDNAEDGDVVALDVQATNEVYVKTGDDADRAVGVVAHQYGYISGYGTPVVVKGRVMANVIGQVSRGDMLLPTIDGCLRKAVGGEKDIAFAFAIESDSRSTKRQLPVWLK